MSVRSGLVLAGGCSRRFGRQDKALAELDDDPLVARVTKRVAPVVDELLVSCRPAQVERFERALSDVPVDRLVEDRLSDVGPLAGIDAGLEVASGATIAIVACDMPFTDSAFIDQLFERITGVEAVVPEGNEGELQPLQAVYRTAPTRAAVSGLLPSGGSVHEILETLEIEILPAGSPPDWSLYNVNTRADLLAAKQQ